jgi:hypothetical protein
MLRDAVALVAIHFDLGQPWLSLSYLVVRSRAWTVLFAMYAWVVPASIVFAARQGRLIRGLEQQFGKPYFLTMKVAGSTGLQPTAQGLGLDADQPYRNR